MHEVKPFYVDVYVRHAKLALPMDFVGRATVVGAYLRPHWHPYTYSAYHVVYKDGRKDTVYADHCRLIRE